jgi:hypothetical protein
MGIFRRAPRPTPPIRRRQQQIARQEAELREKLDQLERMVTRQRTGAPNKPLTPEVERARQSGRTEKRLNVTLALEGEHYPSSSQRMRRPRSLRKERREGRIIFLFLLTALAVAVLWLISHLHS